VWLAAISLWLRHGWVLQLPQDAKLSYFNAEGNMQEVTLGNLTKAKKVSPAGREELPSSQPAVAGRLPPPWCR
jgi:hypothetical protein